jgi:hypothetical protein
MEPYQAVIRSLISGAGFFAREFQRKGTGEPEEKEQGADGHRFI